MRQNVTSNYRLIRKRLYGVMAIACHVGNALMRSAFAVIAETHSADAKGQPLTATIFGGPSRNRTGVQGFAVLCVTTPPSGLNWSGPGLAAARRGCQVLAARQTPPMGQYEATLYCLYKTPMPRGHS
jgi:hypothetical protein